MRTVSTPHHQNVAFQDRMRERQLSHAPSLSKSDDSQAYSDKEAGFQIGKHLLLASASMPNSPEVSQDAQRPTFQPLITPPPAEEDEHGFLSLEQMALQQQQPDYRSPTYSIYGVYSEALDESTNGSLR